MTKLEKKFYKYLNKNVVGTDFLTKEFVKQIAHDLMEIAEGENTEIKEKLRISVECQIQTGKDYAGAADENYTLKKQLAVTKEKITEILESPLGKNYKAENNLTLLKKLREQIASEILGDDDND